MTNRNVIQSGLLAVSVAVAASGWAVRASGQQSQQLVPRPVLKLIIDHPALAGYLHPEAAGRVPLVISDHLLAPGVTPSKFGQPVRILGDREVGSQPHIRFRSFEVQGARGQDGGGVQGRRRGGGIHFREHRLRMVERSRCEGCRALVDRPGR